LDEPLFTPLSEGVLSEEWEEESSTLMMSLPLAIILQEVCFSLMVDISAWQLVVGQSQLLVVGSW